MTTPKSNPSMIGRFTGARGRTTLIDALLRQDLISGDVALARRVAILLELVCCL
jgi:hypothetical protein